MAIDPPGWVRDAVFYEIFPDRFARSERVARLGPLEDWDTPPTTYGFKGGDLLGIAEHLDHVAHLGANALYLTPVFQSASNHRYHTYDYLAVDPLLGGDDALRELLDAAHRRGMRVILDGVFNHTGRGFWAFHHLLESGAASPYRQWFVVDEGALDAGIPIDAYPRAHDRSHAGRGPDGGPWRGDTLARLGYRGWWDLPALPKLNIAEPAVREHIWSVAEHWLRFGIDGWRLDVPGEIQDPAFWAEFRRRCRAVNPEAYLVGEIWDVAPDWTSGDRFDGLMNYPLAEAILGFLADEHLDGRLLRAHREYAKTQLLDGPGFAARLEAILGAYDPATDGAQLNLLDSHDTPRLASILRGDTASLRLAILLQAVLPGAPCVYYGGEVGLQGGLDPDNRRAFPWDEGAWNRDLLAFVQAAFATRGREAALRRGSARVAGAAEGWVAIERGAADDGPRIIAVVNAGPSPIDVPMGQLAGAEPEDGADGHPGGWELVPLPGLDATLRGDGEGAGGGRRGGDGGGEGGGAKGSPSLSIAGRSGAIVRAV